MKRSITRRSLFASATATAFLPVAACTSSLSPSNSEYGLCRAEGESLIAGGQPNCVPSPGAPSDLAWHLRKMAVPEAWSLSSQARRYGKDVLIGHVDTGVAQHEEFKNGGTRTNADDPYRDGGILWERGRDFIDTEPGGYDPLPNAFLRNRVSRGTATASVIVSRGAIVQPPSADLTCGGTAGAGRITGVAPAANLVPVRAFTSPLTPRSNRIADGVGYLKAQGVQVIVIASAWPRGDDVASAIQSAVAADIVVLIAAGSVDEDQAVTFGDAIAIAATGPDDEPSCGSRRGGTVTVSAPGSMIWRAYRDGKSNRTDLIGPGSGTSYAAALTAGVAALWLAHHGSARLSRAAKEKGWSLQDLFRAELARTATKPKGWDAHGDKFGAGIVNAYGLLNSTVS
jgi:hypothetical protein